MSGSLSMSTSPAASQVIDQSLDSLLDFSEYENTYQSPSLSPANKTPFVRPIKTEASTPSLLNTNQVMTGPSHQYDLYKQQTGIVPGALASTLEINSNSQVQGYNSFNAMEYLGMTAQDDLFDFNATPSQAQMPSPELDMDFDSDNLFFETINPVSLGGQESATVPSPPASVGRIWPGMHQQAALAKQQQQQQQQRQQQQLLQQQRQQTAQSSQKQRPKSSMPSDPIVEQKITQLLNSMRAKPSQPMDDDVPLHNSQRSKKDEEDMDEDERLLASEEGKKLSSKERRQLRNKVSARAFRSRRKEYITQLEAEIATKVNENGDLRAHNRALVEENKRLSDLTRMLLSSPSFSNFLDRLSNNQEALPQPAQPQEQARQMPKDVNPYAAQQQITMATIPEQNMDFGMLGLDTTDNFFQPQVFAVLETPEPSIDTSVLNGKTSNFVGQQFDSSEEKVEMPVIERPAPIEVEEVTPAAPMPVDEEFENDPTFALYHAEPAAVAKSERVILEFVTDSFSEVDLFGGIESEKAFARLELIDATEEEATAVHAMARVQALSAGLEGVMARLETLTADL